MLANIYLHWFDKVFHCSGGPAYWANAKLVRFADDLVVLAHYQGYRLQEWIKYTLEDWMCLLLNGEKTRIVNLRDVGARLDFPGFSFRYDADLHGRNKRHLNIFSIEEVGRAGARQTARADSSALLLRADTSPDMRA